MSVKLDLRLRNGTFQISGSVRLPDGETKRVRRSTGFNRDNEAMARMMLAEEVAKWARLVAMGRTGEAGLGAAHAVAESGGCAGAGAGAGSDSDVLVRDVVDVYLERPGGVGETDRGVLNRFRKRFGAIPIGELTKLQVHRWLQRKYKDRERKPGTVAREIKSVNACWRYAQGLGMVEGGLELTSPKVDDARDRWVNEGQRDALLAAFECAEAKALATFLFFTGARLGNALGLEWRHVDLERGTVRLYSKKGRSSKMRWRTVPLTAQAKQAVGEPGDPDSKVFRAPCGKPWYGRNKFYPHWSRACEKVGLEDFRPHDARHTFCSMLVQQGVSLPLVAELVGHSTLEMVKRYSHLSEGHLRAAVGILDARSDAGTDLAHDGEGVLGGGGESGGCEEGPKSLDRRAKWRRGRDSNPRNAFGVHSLSRDEG